MSIEAINEQLLRAIGVGVALIDLKTLRPRFTNDTFVEWFGERGPEDTLAEIIPTIDLAAITEEIAVSGQHSVETTFKLRRRTMTVALEFNLARDGVDRVVVLVCQNITRIKELEAMIDSYSMMVERNTHEIKREKERVEKLLLNMMPRTAYDEYKAFGVVAPRIFDSVSVMTLDFTGFSEILNANDPAVIVSELNDLFTAFDRIGEQFGCERVRTNGDTYFAVSGVPNPVRDHAGNVAHSAVRFMRYLEQRNSSHPIRWTARIGLASGPVIGSVVGVQKYIYDVFGPTVSHADTVRRTAGPMEIAVDASFADLLDSRFALTGVADGGHRLAEAVGNEGQP